MPSFTAIGKTITNNKLLLIKKLLTYFIHLQHNILLHEITTSTDEPMFS